MHHIISAPYIISFYLTYSFVFRIISLNTNLFLKNASLEEKAEAEAQIVWLEKVLLASSFDSTKAKVFTQFSIDCFKIASKLKTSP